jgi:hypothetical protein
MDIRHLRFTLHNLAKLTAHGISEEEVREMLVVDAWVPYASNYHPNQVRIVGPTAAGRLLTVVLEETGVDGEWRPVTGWEATPWEREYHREERR